LQVVTKVAMSKVLIAAGMLLIFIGLFWSFLVRGPWGRLPGDIVIRREHFTFYFPIATSLIVSVFLSLLLWLLRRH